MPRKLKQQRDLLTSMGSYDYFTDPFYLSMVKRVMGSIDLDPASCKEANFLVQAKEYFTIAEDGLKQDWIATNLFMNNPYNDEKKPLSPIWSRKFMSEYNKGHFDRGMMLVNNKWGYSWFMKLIKTPGLSWCLHYERMVFRTPEYMSGLVPLEELKASRQPQATFFAPNHNAKVQVVNAEIDRFHAIFSGYGHCHTNHFPTKRL